MTVDKRKILTASLIVLILVVAGALWYAQRDSGLPDGLIQANGRLEGDRVAISSKFAGKLLALRVGEGDTVKAGQVLAVLDDSQIAAKKAQADAAVAALSAQLDAARQGLAVLEKEVPLGISAAAAARDRAAASSAQAARDAQRYAELLERGSVDRHRAEQMALGATAARTTQIEAEQQLAQARLGGDKVAARRAEVAALAAQKAQAVAAQTEAQSVLDDLTLKAPGSGTITRKLREPGETLAAGSPVLELVDLDRLYLKVYVAEQQIGKVRLGLPARIYTDAFPREPFSARVSFIASRAEFTPKEVQTPDERVKLVYAVKLALDANPAHRLTPGLPADAVIRWDDKVEWQAPRW